MDICYVPVGHHMLPVLFDRISVFGPLFSCLVFLRQILQDDEDWLGHHGRSHAWYFRTCAPIGISDAMGHIAWDIPMLVAQGSSIEHFVDCVILSCCSAMDAAKLNPIGHHGVLFRQGHVPAVRSCRDAIRARAAHRLCQRSIRMQCTLDGQIYHQS